MLKVNSLWPSHAIWHRMDYSTMVQVMACHLSGAKPLPEYMFQAIKGLRKKTWVKFELRYGSFHWRRCILNSCQQNRGHNVLIFTYRGPYAVFKISAGPQTLTVKIWVGPASFPSLSYINFGKIVLRSGKFQILFWRLLMPNDRTA